MDLEILHIILTLNFSKDSFIEYNFAVNLMLSNNLHIKFKELFDALVSNQEICTIQEQLSKIFGNLISKID